MTKVISYLAQRKPFVLFFLAFSFSAFIYTQYFTNISFPDEFDNFANSWLLVKGLVPYRDYFTHHLPTLIFLGVPAEIINHSVLSFRLEVLFLYFSFFALSYFYLKDYLKKSIIPFMVLSSYAIALYGGQQFADGTLWSLTLISAFFIVINNIGKTLSVYEVVVFTILAFATFLSSPIHILGFAMLIIFHLFSQKKQKSNTKKNLINLKVAVISTLIPTFFLVLYLTLTHSLIPFWQSTFEFNNNIYYYHIYPNPYLKIKFLDYYLHTTRDVFNHLFEIFKNQGPYLFRFLSSIKSIIFHPNLILDTNYLKIIFTNLWENFFTFEVFIFLFYICGLIALFKRNKILSLFTLFFIFALRLRLNERIHMAPYYLFSFWMISVTFEIILENIKQRKNTFVNSIFLFGVISLVILFVIKNNYDFSQIAFNHFNYGFEKTASILKSENNNQKILVVAPNMAAYYWKSEHLPAGYFINYYPWYTESPRLKKIWQKNLAEYNGDYLIVGYDLWNNYCYKLKSEFLDESLSYIDSNFERTNLLNTPELVLRRKPQNNPNDKPTRICFNPNDHR